MKSISAKIAVINFSGNVGKTTVAKQLLMPRMTDAAYIPVESLNADEGGGDTVRGSQWGQLSEELMMLDSAIVDVGASNVEDFMRLVNQYRGSHEEIDYFVVPAVPDSKQTRDTIATIDALNAMGVPASKIRVVFNRLEPGMTVNDEFWPILEHARQKKSFIANENAAIETSEIYTRLRQYRTDLGSVLKDATDWRVKLREARQSGDETAQSDAISRISMRRLADSASENLDGVFTALMKKA